jgi:hypothetical protein
MVDYVTVIIWLMLLVKSDFSPIRYHKQASTTIKFQF